MSVLVGANASSPQSNLNGCFCLHIPRTPWAIVHGPFFHVHILSQTCPRRRQAFGVIFSILMFWMNDVFPNSITQYITFTSSGSPWPEKRVQQVSHSRVHPRPAIISIAQFASTAVSAKPSFVYTVSSISPNSSAQPVIWALVSALPSGASPNATLMQHHDPDDNQHRRRRAQTLDDDPHVHDAVVRGNAVAQAVLSGPVIVASIALGIDAVGESIGMPLDSTHKKLGITLFTATHRPAQNYAHALLGLLIVTLAFCQLWTGSLQEYPEWTTCKVPMGVNTPWIIGRY
ncbi:hypothetical protein FIBSPDRAFT_1038272 [Athelia psychrophila]|uniref:Uncharacterized protein n=1 Tax=Athelia psychrophila TaxID=1759441 RepID=A0A166T6X3_9AGAM|nr:hypothetical protein FIBSPDRAFT_1038272 [Fibularhizoctonia sp. CBS 109695]